MRLTYAAAALAGLLMSGCTTSLEQIVDERHQARIDASNANRSLAGGASDGLGSYIAQSQIEEPELAQP